MLTDFIVTAGCAIKEMWYFGREKVTNVVVYRHTSLLLLMTLQQLSFIHSHEHIHIHNLVALTTV